MDERIRTGVPGWVVALVAVAGLFWGGVAGVVLAVVAQEADHEGDESDVTMLTVGPGGKLEVFDPEIGQCFDATVDLDLAAVTDIGRTVDCDAPHMAEVFARVDLPVPTSDASPYDEIGVDGAAFNLCVLLLPGYVGASYLDSPYEVSVAAPTTGAWERGARTATCLLHDVEGAELTSSARRR